MRVGIGYDIHALKKGRKLILGGIEIPHSKGLAGHSDGDALTHAIVDAILGAANEGDIGEHFPDHSPRYQDAQSVEFVRQVRKILKRRRLTILHVDSVVIAEEPKLMPYKKKMREKIARDLGIRVSQVSVKAKTNEGFGAVGERKAIICQAIVSLRGGR